MPLFKNIIIAKCSNMHKLLTIQDKMALVGTRFEERNCISEPGALGHLLNTLYMANAEKKNLGPFFFISWFTGPPMLKFPISEKK
jgi:hypothetical protein